MMAIPRMTDAPELIQIVRAPVEAAIEARAKANTDNPTTTTTCTRPLHIGLIDCYQFSQECLIKAFDGLDPRPVIIPFVTVQKCILDQSSALDLVIYYSHSTNSSEKTILEDVTAIRRAFQTAPIIVLSDAENTDNPSAIRAVLQNGAQGFIPTRTTGIPIAFAAIRLITAGGVFAPPDLLLPKQSEHIVETVQRNQLTPRQVAVLNHLEQGKANKIIAYELGMSESTVKVHVRNIMRKTGATNRTQAAYMAQRLWGSGGMSSLSSGGAY